MVRCDICFEEAAYTCADPGVNPINYCNDCIPVWIRNRADAGEFPLITPEEAPKKKKATSSNADNN